MVKYHKSESWLRRRYYDDKLTVEQIAKKAGVSVKTIIRAFEEYGIR